MSFSELGLSEKVLAAVAEAGYTSPTPIQAQAIPPALARRDVLGIAQTGTGKTAAFTLPMLNRLETGRARARMPRTLILEPTRELAAQVEESFVKLGANHKLSVALLIGGVSFADQDAKITRGVDVLIATPGRLLDHFERGKLLLTGIEVLVIDEADRMLDMGFIPDIERICKMVPFTRQTLFFSATMPPEIQRITEAFLSNPVKVEVARPASTASTITQRLVASGAEAHDKRDVLRRLIRNADDLRNAIIFCNRKRDVAILYRSLEKHGFSVVALHGDMDQRSRMQALDSFRNGSVSLLVASDVAARGLDIPEVSHVFNYDVPFHPEDYVHRIGRTGRAGRTGSAISIVTSHDVKALAAIEELTGLPVEWDGPTLDELLADNPDLDRPDPRRERGRGARTEGRDRRERRSDRRTTSRAEEPRSGSRPARETPARREPARPAPVRQEPVRHEPVRHEPIRAGDRPVHSRARYDDELPVVGFGDHIPAFLLQRVVLGPPTDNLEAEEFDDVETLAIEAPVTGEAAQEEQERGDAREAREPGSGRRRGRRKRTVDISTPADARPQADADADTAADIVAEAPETEPAPVTEPETASAPEPAVEAAPEAETPAPVQEQVAEEPATEEAPTRPARRTRRKPAVAEAEPAAEEPAPAPAPARRRTRKVAAEPVEQAGDADAPAVTAAEEPAAAEPAKPARTRKPRAVVIKTAEAKIAEARATEARATEAKTATAKTAATRKTATRATAKATSADTAAAEEAAAAAPQEASPEAPAEKPVRKRATRKKVEAEGDTPEKPAPRRTRKKPATAEAAQADAGDQAEAPAQSPDGLSLVDAHSPDA